MLKDPKFYNKNGTLTRYALSCGYVESQSKDNRKIELYKEHSTYHVRAFDYSRVDCRLLWQTFPTNSLTKARQQYMQAKRELLAK